MSELRRKILDASITLVAERGVRAVSFREVARRAGVSHQAPYHIFGNHRGILRAIAAEGFGELADRMQAAAEAEAEDPLAALSAAGRAYVAFARGHLGHFRVMFRSSLLGLRDEGGPLPEAARTFTTVGRLAEAVAAAGYAPSVGGETLAHLAWATVHGFASLLVEGALADKGATDPAAEDALAERVVGALEGLVRRDRAPPGSA